MAKAVWEGAVIAESNDCVMVEGNHYFPGNSVKKEHLEPSIKTTVCPWKGTANYYDVVVGAKRNEAAAWYYATPSSAAQQIRGHIAFWKGVRVA